MKNNKKTCECSVSGRWFDLIAEGKKTVEGRLNLGKFAALGRGDLLGISKSGDATKRVLCRVRALRMYVSFEQYLASEGLCYALPGVTTIAEGVAVYHEFYPPERASKHGVVAVELSLVSSGFEEALREARRVASTKNVRSWNANDPEVRHIEEHAIVTRVVGMIAASKLSCDEAAAVCTPLSRLAKMTSLRRWFA